MMIYVTPIVAATIVADDKSIAPLQFMVVPTETTFHPLLCRVL